MKTTTMDTIRIENIPQELRDRKAWVTWRVEHQGGRTVKPPFNPRTSRKAKSNDPSTWGSFDEALGAYESGGYDGIGFQLTSPFVGVDLDGCRNPESGFIDDGAQAIIEQLDSYTEVSPSGRGIHILAEGQLPPGRHRISGVELYDRGRYFTVTGRQVADTPSNVESRSVELAALHLQLFGQEPSAVPRTVESQASTKAHASASVSDEDLVVRMKAANDGQRFERLWRGEWEDDYESQSHADLALCAKLAFWTGRDADRIDRAVKGGAKLDHRGGGKLDH